MDGYGIRRDVPGNALLAADTPHLEAIFRDYPCCELSASGLDVGLPAGQMGNSEVGHTNLGAGRVVFQDLPKISLAVDNGEFFRNPAYLAAMEHCRKHGTALHLMGLLSDGGVHSHITHLFALLEMAKREGLEKVYVHAFLDGRDVSPTSGLGFVRQLLDKMRELGSGTLADLCGRFYAMDRDSRWERLQRAYDMLVCGEAPVCADAVQAMQASYDAGVTDEFVEPVIVTEGCTIGAEDSVIFCNFRPDRAREITRALCDPDFTALERKRGFFPLHYVCTTQYAADIPNVSVAFPKDTLANILGACISRAGLTQLRIAETEKYAHVTFFFNGGEEQVFPGEDRVLIPSPKVETYDLKPEMSAYEVTDEAVKRILSGQYDMVILNFANCDMVGHTGVFDAAVAAAEAVDACVARVAEATMSMGGITLITADHGNAEQMTAEDGSPFTAHTTNPVPFCIIGADVRLREGGRLADIAPTMLDLMGLAVPEEMSGRTLIAN